MSDSFQRLATTDFSHESPPPGSRSTIPFTSEHNHAFSWSGPDSHELLLLDPVGLPEQDSSHTEMKFEPEFEAQLVGADFDDQEKEEFGIDLNWMGEPNTDAGDMTAWQPTTDLMEVVLADTAESGFGIRLDDDVFVEANKESAPDIFEVLFTS